MATVPDRQWPGVGGGAGHDDPTGFELLTVRARWLASIATHSAGSPSSAAPVAVPVISPSTSKTQPSVVRSASPGAIPSAPIITRAAEVLSAITSGSVKLNASYRESITSMPADDLRGCIEHITDCHAGPGSAGRDEDDLGFDPGVDQLADRNLDPDRGPTTREPSRTPARRHPSAVAWRPRSGPVSPRPAFAATEQQVQRAA